MVHNNRFFYFIRQLTLPQRSYSVDVVALAPPLVVAVRPATLPIARWMELRGRGATTTRLLLLFYLFKCFSCL